MEKARKLSRFCKVARKSKVVGPRCHNLFLVIQVPGSNKMPQKPYITKIKFQNSTKLDIKN